MEHLMKTRKIIQDSDLRFDDHFESHLFGNGLYTPRPTSALDITSPSKFSASGYASSSAATTSGLAWFSIARCSGNLSHCVREIKERHQQNEYQQLTQHIIHTAPHMKSYNLRD